MLNTLMLYTMKLSIDLGGTNIRIAQVEKGNCLNKVSVPCLAQQDASTVLNQLSQLIRNMMNEQVDGIGIGVPSINFNFFILRTDSMNTTGLTASCRNT